MPQKAAVTSRAQVVDPGDGVIPGDQGARLSGGAGTMMQKVTVARASPRPLRRSGNRNCRLENRFGELLQREMQHTPEVDVRRRDRADSGNVLHR